jgi:biotin carboxyl carrier protein
MGADCAPREPAVTADLKVGAPYVPGTYHVTINGRAWKVALELADHSGRVVAIVKGRRRTLEVAWIDANTVSLIGVDKDHHAVRELGVRRREQGAYDLVLEGRTFHAVTEREKAGARKTRDAVAAEGLGTVVGPMPGLVIRLLAAVGDRVKAGQGVIVVEAMKMENELRSPKDGIVREVNARPGTAVEVGAVLMVIE